MKTFYIRTLTAVVFVIIMLCGMLWNPFSFCLLFLIISVAALWEYFKLVKRIYPEYKKTPVYQLVLTSLLLPAGFLIASGHDFTFMGQTALFLGLQLLLFILMLLLIATGIGKHPTSGFRNLVKSLVGAVYVGVPFSLFIYLMWHFSIENVPVIPLGIIGSLWINDTLAYISGSLIGKTPFAPKISPKKTWEGTLGGIILTLIAAAIYGYFSSYFSIGIWIGIAGITAITGTAGDLLESFLKRKTGVKDSGTLMPGHGGILDRFDSLIMATPFVWLLLMIITP